MPREFARTGGYGAGLISGTRTPLGRPRWLAQTTHALIAGTIEEWAGRRGSAVVDDLGPASGTLESTRQEQVPVLDIELVDQTVTHVTLPAAGSSAPSPDPEEVSPGGISPLIVATRHQPKKVVPGPGQEGQVHHGARGPP